MTPSLPEPAKNTRDAAPLAGDRSGGVKMRNWKTPLLLFVLALGVRGVYLVEDSSSPFFEYRGLDARDYHRMAVEFTQGEWPGPEPFFWPPLYPLSLGVLYKLVGHSVATIKTAHAILGALSCVLTYFIARLTFPGRFVPIAAAVACSLCGTLILFDGQLLSGSLDVTLQLLTLWIVLRAGRRGSLRIWALAGTAIGLSVINRGSMLLYIPLVLAWIYALSRRQWTPAPDAQPPAGRPPFYQSALALLLPVMLLVFPVSWHNARYDAFGTAGTMPPPSTATENTTSFGETLERFVSGKFALLASPLGLNFHLGNHWQDRHLNDPNHSRSFLHYDRIISKPARNGVTSASAQSRYLINETLHDIRDAPLDFARLMGLKLFHLVSGDERPRNSNVYAFRQHSVLLSLLLWKHVVAFPSGLLIPLGLFGVLLVRRSWRDHFPIIALMAAQGAFILAFFVSARYRLPSLPILAIYAAFAAQSLARSLSLRGSTRTFAQIATLSCLLVLSNTGLGKMKTSHGSFEHQNLGIGLIQQGRTDEAMDHFHRAVRLSPDRAAARNSLANMLLLEGKTDGAVAQYETALRLDPDNPKTHNNLGKALARQGKTDEAIEQYREALRLVPHFADAQRNLGLVHVKARRLDLAASAFRKCLQHNPDWPEIHHDLALTLAWTGNVEQAVRHYREALRLRPGFADAHYNLANALAKRGDGIDAVAHYKKVIQLRPDFPEAHLNLANVLVILNKPDEAVVHYTRALQLSPALTKARYPLATLLEKRGRRAEAAEQYRRILRIDPGHTGARQKLNAILERRNRGTQDRD